MADETRIASTQERETVSESSGFAHLHARSRTSAPLSDDAEWWARVSAIYIVSAVIVIYQRLILMELTGIPMGSRLEKQREWRNHEWNE